VIVICRGGQNSWVRSFCVVTKRHKPLTFQLRWVVSGATTTSKSGQFC
jgi:hypothetical protein